MTDPNIGRPAVHLPQEVVLHYLSRKRRLLLARSSANGRRHNSANGKPPHCQLSLPPMNSSHTTASPKSTEEHSSPCSSGLLQGLPMERMSLICNSFCWRSRRLPIYLGSTAASLPSRCSLSEQREGREFEHQDTGVAAQVGSAQRLPRRGEWSRDQSACSSVNPGPGFALRRRYQPAKWAALRVGAMVPRPESGMRRKLENGTVGVRGTGPQNCVSKSSSRKRRKQTCVS